MTNKEYVLNKITSTDVCETPWRHLIIKDFIPTSLYDAVKKEVQIYEKKFKKMKAVGRGYTTEVNISQNIFPNKKRNPHLYEYYQIITNRDIETAIKTRVNISEYHSDVLSTDIWSSFDIQSSGFIYDVHPDHESKIHTLVHYMADFDDDKTLGTALYTPNVDTFGGYYWEMKKPLDTVRDFLKRADYEPNTAILFSPCTKMGYITNHSMFHLSEKTKHRKTLQTFWLKENEDWTNVEWSAINLKK